MKIRSKSIFKFFTFFALLVSLFGSALTFTPAYAVPSGTTLSINDVSLSEGNAGTTSYSFTVSVSAPASIPPVSFDIATQDNSATIADNDYVSKSLTMNVPNRGSYTFTVLVNGDTTVEPDETFFVNVTNATGGGGVTIMDGQGQGTIVNDDIIYKLFLPLLLR
jgi:hypothetical protein